MAAKDWTQEQTHNAMMYGICPICRAPRESKLVEVLNKTGYARPDGEPEFVTERRLICPNGHPQ